MSGKGDKPRPMFVSRKVYDDNYDNIFRKTPEVISEATKKAEVKYKPTKTKMVLSGNKWKKVKK